MLQKLLEVLLKAQRVESRTKGAWEPSEPRLRNTGLRQIFISTVTIRKCCLLRNIRMTILLFIGVLQCLAV